MKKPKQGTDYYKDAGLTHPIVIHLSEPVHLRLKKVAENEDRSVQATARRMIEDGVKRARTAA